MRKEKINAKKRNICFRVFCFFSIISRSSRKPLHKIRVICVIRGPQKKFPYLVVPSLMPCPPVSKQSSTASRPMRE